MNITFNFLQICKASQRVKACQSAAQLEIVEIPAIESNWKMITGRWAVSAQPEASKYDTEASK